ncbi:MAG: lipid II flippase MurJ [Bryobacteraceae bacterium]
MVMANKFGAGLYYDAFLLAFRSPSMMRTLFAEGALSSAFIPTFTAPSSRFDEASSPRVLEFEIDAAGPRSCAASSGAGSQHRESRKRDRDPPQTYRGNRKTA